HRALALARRPCAAPVRRAQPCADQALAMARRLDRQPGAALADDWRQPGFGGAARPRDRRAWRNAGHGDQRLIRTAGGEERESPRHAGNSPSPRPSPRKRGEEVAALASLPGVRYGRESTRTGGGQCPTGSILLDA